jgi:hypothetical protein
MEKVSCVECGYECKLNYLGTHLKLSHNSNLKEYYDKFYKKENESICCECGSPTNFKSLKDGYSKTCNVSCSNKYRNKLLLEKFGVVNNFQLESIKNKSKETIKEKYGVENVSQSNVIKQKKIDTCLKNYGVEWPSYSKTILDRQATNNLKKYGVFNVMHVNAIAQKAALNGGGRASAHKYITKFGNELLVQGTYEKLFVNFCEDNNIYIENGPCIDYIKDSKKHRYFIDFKVVIENQIKLVEIKSTYWYNKYKETVDLKNKYALEYAKKNNYYYHFIVNDNNKKQINVKKFNIILEINNEND